MNISDLPTELQFKILLNLDDVDIIRYCENRLLPSNICNDVYFWRQVAVEHGFPSEINNIDDYMAQKYNEFHRWYNAASILGVNRRDFINALNESPESAYSYFYWKTRAFYDFDISSDNFDRLIRLYPDPEMVYYVFFANDLISKKGSNMAGYDLFYSNFIPLYNELHSDNNASTVANKVYDIYRRLKRASSL